MRCLLVLTKCFNVINHELIKKQMHGIEAWLAAYLQGHTQSASLCHGPGRNVVSQTLSNTMGVFQRSSMGHLSFRSSPKT